jgi:peroxiredoxin
MRRGLWVAAVFGAGLAVGGLGGWQAGRAQSAGLREEGLQQGQWPPRFTAKDVSGTRHTLEQYEGSILVLHFWASWCPFCRGEIPKLTTLTQPEWTERGVAVLTVGLDKDPDQLRRFLGEEDLPYPVISDIEQSLFLADQYEVSAIPVTYVLGRDGRIRFRLVGQSDIMGAVKTTLNESTFPKA